jgi:hypothetical protein
VNAKRRKHSFVLSKDSLDQENCIFPTHLFVWGLTIPAEHCLWLNANIITGAEKRLDSDPLQLGRSDSLVSDLSSIAKVRSVSKTAYTERYTILIVVILN